MNLGGMPEAELRMLEADARRRVDILLGVP